jgi:TPR repeat
MCRCPALLALLLLVTIAPASRGEGQPPVPGPADVPVGDSIPPYSSAAPGVSIDLIPSGVPSPAPAQADDFFFNNRGLAELAKGENNQAIADFDDALRLNPTDPILYYNRASAYYKRAIAAPNSPAKPKPEDRNRALDDLFSSISRSPSRSEPYLLRARIYGARAFAALDGAKVRADAKGCADAARDATAKELADKQCAAELAVKDLKASADAKAADVAAAKTLAAAKDLAAKAFADAKKRVDAALAAAKALADAARDAAAKELADKECAAELDDKDLADKECADAMAVADAKTPDEVNKLAAKVFDDAKKRVDAALAAAKALAHPAPKAKASGDASAHAEACCAEARADAASDAAWYAHLGLADYYMVLRNGPIDDIVLAERDRLAEQLRKAQDVLDDALEASSTPAPKPCGDGTPPK